MSLPQGDERVEALRKAETNRIVDAAEAKRTEADAVNTRRQERLWLEQQAPLSYKALIQELRNLAEQYNKNAPTPLEVRDSPYSTSFSIPGFLISLTNGPLYSGKVGGFGTMVGIMAYQVYSDDRCSKLGALEFHAEFVANEGIHWRRGKQSVNIAEIANLTWNALVARKCEDWDRPLIKRGW
jgi:hypothetical protein